MIISTQENISMQHVFTVSELLKYDLIYIYHHISDNSKFTLKKNEIQLDGNYNYEVFFKNFKIGSLAVSSFFTALYGELEVIDAEVSSITKEKYLPIKALDIVVEPSTLQHVS